MQRHCPINDDDDGDGDGDDDGGVDDDLLVMKI